MPDTELPTTLDKARRGRFVTVEGVDGAGKSTHLAAIAERLHATGAAVTVTREPGGTPLAERLRELLLQTPMDPLTEALLVFAARRDHVEQTIWPALDRGDTVLCDRFTDATFAYQGGGRRFDLDVLRTLEGWVHPGLQPDLTLWFDLPVELAAARRAGARAADRFERQDVAFFSSVRAAYLDRLREAPTRFVRIDAAQSIEAVRLQIDIVLKARGW